MEVKYAQLNNHVGYEVDMYGSATLVNEKKGLVSQISFGFDNYYQCNYEIWGSKGKVIVDRAFTAGPDITPKVIIEKQDHRQEFLLPSDNQCANLLSEFMECMMTNDFKIHKRDFENQAKLLDAIRWRNEIG